MLEVVARDRTTLQSVEVVNSYLGNMVETTKGGGSSYPARLSSSGAAKNETAARVKMCFLQVLTQQVTTLPSSAGTWSPTLKCEIISEMPDGWLIWHFRYLQLRKEIEANAAVMAHLQTLPCLERVVKEAPPLSMAISCRLPRVVPKEGWTFDGCFFPSGTNARISAFELYLNPKTFP